MTMLHVWAVALLAANLAAGARSPKEAQQPPALEIVVIAGEDAVNIIQQKTAVDPVVEVRDRNDLPVAGAVVVFTVRGGQNAALNGAVRTVSVTTNAAGGASVSLTPTTPGVVRLDIAACPAPVCGSATVWPIAFQVTQTGNTISGTSQQAAANPNAPAATCTFTTGRVQSVRQVYFGQLQGCNLSAFGLGGCVGDLDPAVNRMLPEKEPGFPPGQAVTCDLVRQ